MKIIHKDLRAGDLKVQVQNMDDLWYLSHVVDNGDLVKGKTFRKLKIGKEPNVKVVKKPVFLVIEVEKVEFHKFSNSLRVSGKVREGSEDVPRGSYHTFDVSEGTIISIHKEKWYKYQVEKVEDATKDVGAKVLICVLDRENASFALMKQYGYDYLSDLKGDVRKKGDEGKEKESSFYFDISAQIKEYAERFKVENIIIGSPAFWKEDLMKVFSKKCSELANKVTLATCNNVGKNGINEVLKRDEVKTVLSKDRAAKEIKMVDNLLKEISKDGTFAYGFDEVKMAAEAGAVSVLLVTDELILKYRNEEKYSELDSVMKLVDNSKGEIHIISADHEGGKKLEGLGGVGALLRYKVNY